MKKAPRYRTSHLIEDQFEPGSNGQVLKNKLGIRSPLQAGLPLLNFGLISGEKKKEYFEAIQAGLDKNYAPMEKLFLMIIEKSDVVL
ncbi:MAG TPA: hypothetical protein VFG09_14415 [Thermodesulfovibrionales bacterium]|nr:hypothetical protein [Thermodesulfovibrionales bacterium]